MISRSAAVRSVTDLLDTFPVVAILGARQIGKTTLAREIERGTRREVHHFDLESPRDRDRLSDPTGALEGLRGLVVLDEIQRVPEIFPLLRVLADRPRRPARFLVLGSATPALLRQTSESLAGRIAHFELDGLSLAEVAGRPERLWLRGGFPRAFVARSDAESARWRRSFIGTFLERDLPELGFRIPSATLHRFWSMLAHYHGQIWNAAELARAFGVSEHTVRGYLDVLASTFVVRVLPPWFENLSKRQVKAPKVFIRDSGLLHALLGIEDRGQLDLHPKVGASWEGFVLEQLRHHLGADPQECFYWRTQQGAELDLLVFRGRRRFGFEVKHTAVPSLTPSMRIAVADLKLDRLDVVFRGNDVWPMADKVRAVGVERMLEEIAPLK